MSINTQKNKVNYKEAPEKIPPATFTSFLDFSNCKPFWNAF